MVNKQYNVQSAKKSKNYSPPPNRNSVTVISSAPNPVADVQKSFNNLDRNNEAVRTERHPNQQHSVYGQNITYVHNDEFDICDDNCERLNHKDLSIKDIGRFQYILQMDREMVSFNSKSYRIKSIG